MRANLVFNVLGAVLSFIGLVAGILNVVGWLFVIAFRDEEMLRLHVICTALRE